MELENVSFKAVGKGLKKKLAVLNIEKLEFENQLIELKKKEFRIRRNKMIQDIEQNLIQRTYQANGQDRQERIENVEDTDQKMKMNDEEGDDNDETETETDTLHGMSPPRDSTPDFSNKDKDEQE